MAAIKIYNGTSWVELAKKSDIKKVYRHEVYFDVGGFYSWYTFYSTSSSNISVNDLMLLLQNKVCGDGYGDITSFSYISGGSLYYTHYYKAGGTYQSDGILRINSQTAIEV